MRIFVFTAVMLLAASAVWYFTIREKPLNSEHVMNRLVENNPDLAQVEIDLSDCQLSIRTEQVVGDGANFTLAALKADLTLFEFYRARIISKKSGQAVLLASRKPPSNRLISQAKKILSLAPFADQKKGGELTMLSKSGVQTKVTPLQRDELNDPGDEKLRNIFTQPNGTLTFRLTSVSIRNPSEPAKPIEPHEDAPEFYAFSEAVSDLDGPMTASITLLFQGSKPVPESLLSGAVIVPNQLQFAAKSKESAEALLKTLFLYQQGHCPI